MRPILVHKQVDRQGKCIFGRIHWDIPTGDDSGAFSRLRAADELVVFGIPAPALSALRRLEFDHLRDAMAALSATARSRTR